MIRTEQETRYEERIDANCTLQNFISGHLCALPNVGHLEELWNELPPPIEGKPLRCLLNEGALLYEEPQRFFMNRLSDVTGVSGTGRVVNGVILPSGKVVLEWKHPHQTIGIYDNFQQFIIIHVESHPDANEVIFID